MGELNVIYSSGVSIYIMGDRYRCSSNYCRRLVFFLLLPLIMAFEAPVQLWSDNSRREASRLLLPSAHTFGGSSSLLFSSSMPLHDLMDSGRDTFLLGNVGAMFVGFIRGLRKIRPGINRIIEVIDPVDLGIILTIGFGSSAIAKWWNDKVINKTIRRHYPKEFSESKLKFFSDLVCQLGQCSFLAYLGEIFLSFLDVVGLHLPRSAPRFIMVSTYAVWGAGRVSAFKTSVLKRVFRTHPSFPKHGSKVLPSLPITGVLFSRVLDIMIFLLTSIIVMELCNVKVGVVVKSLLSVAGFSSLIIGLSLRDPATQIIEGTSLLLLDRFRPGDKIKLSDGTVGRVISIGWLDTTLASTDDIHVRIPNSEIASKRIANVSRAKRSQVKQTIRLRYDDIDKIPKLVDDLKEEVKAACPKLVLDGSRPFRVHWRSMADDHVSVVVDTHHDIPPMTQLFYDNQQRLMIAIATAVKKNGMKFALPAKISYREKLATDGMVGGQADAEGVK